MGERYRSRRPRLSRRQLAWSTIIVLVFGFWLIPVTEIEAPHSTVLFSQEGELLGARIAVDEQWRYPATSALPERYVRAVQVYEDKRFQWHFGVDPIAIVRAMVQNIRAGTVVSGGSTITMQTVRIARHRPQRTIFEKCIEAILAVRLEVAASKEEILSLYANNAPFGGNTVGIESASWRYFGRRPNTLSWAEAATLAVLPNSPSLIHPGRNRSQLKEKRDRVLQTLHSQGDIDEVTLQLALTEPLPRPPRSRNTEREAPHLVGAAKGRVQTTLSQSLQQLANEIVLRHHQQLLAMGVHNLAVLVAEIDTGRVLAYVGNVPGKRDRGGYVDVVQARRSTGSLLKPFLYAFSLDSGGLTPHQIVPDLPMRFGGFSPENFDHSYRGVLPASEALARSRNLPAAWLLKQYGIPHFYGDLQRLGMTTLHRPAEDYGLSLILGGAEGSLWNMVSLYRKLAWSASRGEGELPAMHWHGEPQTTESNISQAAAWLTVEALKQVRRPGELASWEQFDSAPNIAWKTGTSIGFRDGLAIGVTPAHVVGVWAGNSDGEGRPDLTGHRAAAPVLFDLFAILPDIGWFEKPQEGLIERAICLHSGQRAGPYCEQVEHQVIPESAAQSKPCSYCRQIQCDEGCRHQITTSCADITQMHTENRFVLKPAAEWFYRRDHPEYVPLPPWKQGCAPNESVSAMEIITPAVGAQIFVPLELSGLRGQVVFEANHREGNAVVYWHLDDEYLGKTKDFHKMDVSPDPGEHVLTLVDDDGNRSVRRFRVMSRE